MSRRPRAPQEDPETKARREAAQLRADETREDALQGMVTERTSELLRRFGMRAAMAGAGSMGLGSFVAPSTPPAYSGGGSTFGGGATSGGFGRGRGATLGSIMTAR